eukprot:GHVO01068489.1.p1 GENE.GHVO01068489.1~~GHVO01068489.1.p1  ORF type:complete len:198 (+),score=15.98 GHVO01068489.1:76-669(+)
MNLSTLSICLLLAIGVVSAARGQRQGRGQGRGQGGGRGQGRGQGRRGNRGPCLLCRIEGVDGAELELPEQQRPTGECPDESTCSVGPMRVTHMGSEAQLTFCDAKDSNGNLRVFERACRIELDDEDETVINRAGRGRRGCPTGENCCTKGPLTGFTYNDVAAEAYFPERMGSRRPGNMCRNFRQKVVEPAEPADDNF